MACAERFRFVGPEPAYLELVTDGGDGFVVRSQQDIIDVLRRLIEDDALESRVRAAVHRRAADYDPELILDRWAAEIAGAASSRRSPRQIFLRRAAASGRYCILISRRAVGRLRRALERIRV